MVPTRHTANEAKVLLQVKLNGCIISHHGDVNCPSQSNDFLLLYNFLCEISHKPSRIEQLADDSIRYIKDFDSQLCCKIVENMNHLRVYLSGHTSNINKYEPEWLIENHKFKELIAYTVIFLTFKTISILINLS